ncbi:MAG: ABC transporter substrate-binding protein [Actinomycetia bacterium]|nr:ABC transporter substrate-binding protein [Actinomycetes bacterium]
MARRERRTGKKAAAAAAATVLAVGLAGCGGVATSNSGGSTTTTSSAPKVIKIGAPYPLTGDWAQNGQNCLNGMELAAQFINRSGGIKALGGAKVEIVPADTSSNSPSQAESVTARLITSDHVVALVGSYLSSLTLTSTTAAEQYHVPMITQSYVDTLTERGYHYTFKLPPQASVLGSYAINTYKQIADQLGHPVHNVAIVGSNDASNVAQMAAVKKQAQAVGWNVTVYDLYPVGLTDAAPVANAVAQGHPDLIVAGGDLPDLGLVVKAIRGIGITAPILGPSGGGWLTYGFWQTLGHYAQGALSVSTWNDDLKMPGVAQEAKAYEQKFHTPFEPQEAGESFTAVYDIVEAINLAHSADPVKIADALRNHLFDTGYAADMTPGKVEFDSTGLDKYSVPIMIQWQNGVPRTVWPKSLATAPIIQPG